MKSPFNNFTSLFSYLRMHTFAHKLACLAVLAMFFLAPLAEAHTIDKASNTPTEEPSKTQWQAIAFPVLNSAQVKVHVENPKKTTVHLIIRNSNNEIVFKKSLGKAPLFRGNYDL